MKLNIHLDDREYSRFKFALELNAENEEEVIKNLINNYSKSAILHDAETMGFVKLNDSKDTNPYYGKAKRKISRWVARRDRIPFKIIRAYLLLEKEKGTVTLSDLKNSCCHPDDKEKKETYVGDEKKFDSNFSQLKYDSEKSYGKVFEVFEEVNGKRVVTLWKEIKPVIDLYKEEITREQKI